MKAATQKYADIAQAMGVNIHGMTAMEAAQASADAVRQLSRDIGIPARLSDAGVKAESIPVMVANAMADHCHASNARDCDDESMTAIYEAAL
jgi:alcohol dehydrogenase